MEILLYILLLHCVLVLVSYFYCMRVLKKFISNTVITLRNLDLTGSDITIFDIDKSISDVESAGNGYCLHIKKFSQIPLLNLINMISCIYFIKRMETHIRILRYTLYASKLIKDTKDILDKSIAGDSSLNTDAIIKPPKRKYTKRKANPNKE